MTEIWAGSSTRFPFTLTDTNGDPVPAVAVLTLTFSLKNVDTDAYIGAWNNRDVKGVNGGTLNDGGGYVDVPPSDSAMVSTSDQRERHLGVIKYTTANEAGSCECRFVVKRVAA